MDGRQGWYLLYGAIADHNTCCKAHSVFDIELVYVLASVLKPIKEIQKLYGYYNVVKS